MVTEHQTFGAWLEVRVVWLVIALGLLTFWLRFLPWLVREFR